MSEMKEWIAERQIDLVLEGYTVDDAFDKACIEWGDREAMRVDTMEAAADDYGDMKREEARARWFRD